MDIFNHAKLTSFNVPGIYISKHNLYIINDNLDSLPNNSFDQNDRILILPDNKFFWFPFQISTTIFVYFQEIISVSWKCFKICRTSNVSAAFCRI